MFISYKIILIQTQLLVYQLVLKEHLLLIQIDNVNLVVFSAWPAKTKKILACHVQKIIILI